MQHTYFVAVRRQRQLLTIPYCLERSCEDEPICIGDRDVSQAQPPEFADRLVEQSLHPGRSVDEVRAERSQDVVRLVPAAVRHPVDGALQAVS